MLCVPLSSMFTCYCSTFRENLLRFGHLLLKTAVTKLANILFVCFIQAANYDVVDLFMPARLQALGEDGRLCAYEGALVPLLSEMIVNVLKRVLLRHICNCAADPLSATLVFARLGKIDWTAPDCVGWSPSEFAGTAINYVPKWQDLSSKHAFEVILYPGSLIQKWLFVM